MNDLIQTITVYAIPVVFAITLHEAAHGYVARHFGDLTAYSQGRVTLNPLKHIDPLGTIVIPLVLALLPFGFVFGYAKPVPVSFGNLRNPKRDMIWVALAGPAANFLQAVIWALLGIVAALAGIREPFVSDMISAGVIVNFVVAAFNLFPIPPLDGGRIVMGLLPMRASLSFARLEPYGFFVVLALVAIPGLLSRYWLAPIVGAMQGVLGLLFAPFL